MIMGKFADIKNIVTEKNKCIKKSKHLSQDLIMNLIGNNTKERVKLLIESKQ